jgi:hypothetical protein
VSRVRRVVTSQPYHWTVLVYTAAIVVCGLVVLAGRVVS